MFCTECGREIAESFKFCRNCGHSISESEIRAVTPAATDTQLTVTGTDDAVAEDAPRAEGRATTPKKSDLYVIGTVIFGAFALISGIVSIAKGLPPISILETLFWVGAAWFWQRNKPEDGTVIAAVVALGVVVMIGEIASYAYQDANRGADGATVDGFQVTPFDKIETPYDAPDKAHAVIDGLLACDEADRLVKLCAAQGFQSSDPYTPYGGYSTPLKSLPAAPKLTHLDPNPDVCTTVYGWRNYCHANPPRIAK